MMMRGRLQKAQRDVLFFRFIMIWPLLVIKALYGHLRKIGKCGKIKPDYFFHTEEIGTVNSNISLKRNGSKLIYNMVLVPGVW